jgi:Putative prokaryotic signal transducing protein
MAMIDPDRERQRLADHFARKIDGELERVAGQAYELTDAARNALRAEMEKRGLTPNFAEHLAIPVNPVKKESPAKLGEAVLPESATSEISPDNENEVQELTVVRVFRDLPQALLAQGCLESAGIECMLADDNLVRLDWFYSNAVGGIKLLVSSADAREAEQILDEPIPEHMEVDGVGDYEQPKCPKCGSLDVNFRELDPATYLGLGGSYWGMFIPIPIYRRAWSCRSCQAEWEDDEVHEKRGPGSAAPSD